MSTTIANETVAAFIEATNAHDAGALAGLFGAEATVSDDGTDYTGSIGIPRWIQDHQIAPLITLTPVAFEDGSAPLLTADADGNFPGGPLRFDFRFTLTHGRITRLAITPAH